MLVYFSKEKEEEIREQNVNALDIITDKYVLRIRKSGVTIDKVEVSIEGKRSLVPVYDETFNLT
jgi:hypothetical protein